MAVNLEKKASLKSSSREGASPLLSWILPALVVATLAELLIWRTFSRIGVFIPKDEPRMAGFRTFYGISVQVGTIILNFAVLLTVITLVLMVIRLKEQDQLAGPGSRYLRAGVVATALAMSLSFGLLILVEDTLASTVLRLSLAFAFGAYSLDYWQNHRSLTARIFISLLAWGYIIPLVAKMLHDLLPLAGLNWQIFLYEPLLEGGELLVVINGFLAFMVYGNRTVKGSLFKAMLKNWPALLGAVVLVGIFLFLTFITVAESSIVPILGLYALGYTMHWPMALYTVALFFLAYTVFYNLGRSAQGFQERAAAFGLVLIFCGGYFFNISHQYLLALAGVILLVRPSLAQKQT